MYTNFYTLPEVSFVGGATQELKFNLKDESGNNFDADDCTANFSICDYSTRDVGAGSIVSISPTLSGSLLTVTIPASDTVNLSGKYIYQITIKDAGGETLEFQIPNQGIMYIARNNNPGYITNELNN